ncbi:MAG: hypothetical protein ISN26_06650, partial [Betaproteobacteria bacterium AqS2]|nr:hypothetical protein [Betaproteobacteria bacterium AqS2]
MKGLRINPERLQWCLRHYCLTLKKLAKRAGLKSADLRRASEGEQGLNMLEIRRIAKSLELDTSFLMQEKGVSRDELRTPQFRAAGGQPPRTTEMMLLLRRVENHREYF